MSKTVSKFTLAVGFVLALIFTAGCAASKVAQEAETVGTATGDSFTDSRDGKTYKTVKIGERVWMAENLNYNANGSKCYDNDENNCKKYGRLYDISTAMKACPSGWSLPPYGVRGIEGYDETLIKKLKSASGWSNNGNGTDDYGFSALPGGRYYDGRFHDVGKEGYWWGAYDSNEDVDGDGAYYWSISYSDGELWNPSKGMNPLLSVRCARNLTAAEAAARKAEVAAQEAKEAVRVAALQNSFTDSRDGKTYKTVKIGEQIWMAENLNYDASGNKCYDNRVANCEKYGRLYDWNTALEACPSGWHLPSLDEYEALDNTVGGGNTAAKKLKSASGWNNNGNGTDEYGFSALPGGYGDSDGSFFSVGETGDWWIASEHSGDDAYYRRMLYVYESTHWHNYSKSSLRSVRCVKD